MNALDLIASGADRLTEAGVEFGHGTDNARDESAWLVLWGLGLPLDTPDEDLKAREVDHTDEMRLDALFRERIDTRKPAAYLTQEAWLQGVPFYVDERAIVPRSFIAELIMDPGFDSWLKPDTRRVLDLCTGNGSLAVLAAKIWPELTVDASDLSNDALSVAAINRERHDLRDRIRLQRSDGLADVPGPYDLILCNPPYVNAASMAALPAEYRAEPELALAGGADGMDFVRALLRDAPSRLNPAGVLVLEIGHERAHFEAAFPRLEAIWLETSAGEDQVLLLTREAIVQGQPTE